MLSKGCNENRRTFWRTVNRQGDGFTHTIWVSSRATECLSRAGPTWQCCHSQFKTTACPAAHLDGWILSAYIILICRVELVGQCLGPRDKWRTFQMTGAGQPRPVIPLIATHSSAAFLAAISPGAPFCLWVCPHNGNGTHAFSSHTPAVISHKHTLLGTHPVSPSHTHTHTDSQCWYGCVLNVVSPSRPVLPALSALSCSGPVPVLCCRAHYQTRSTVARNLLANRPRERQRGVISAVACV